MLIIVRHGRTAANARRLLQGRVDHPLDELGRRQAVAAGQAIRLSVGDPNAPGLGPVPPVAQVISSPLLRARQTAEIVREQLGSVAAVQAIVEDSGWAELSYGEWEDRPVAEVAASEWKDWRADPHFAPPGGESLVTLTERVWSACERAAEAVGDEGTVVVCSHVSPIKAAVAWSLGLGDPEAAVAMSWQMHVDQAQITWVGFRRDEPVLWSFNSTEHLIGAAWDASSTGGRATK